MLKILIIIVCSVLALLCFAIGGLLIFDYLRVRYGMRRHNFVDNSTLPYRPQRWHKNREDNL